MRKSKYFLFFSVAVFKLLMLLNNYFVDKIISFFVPYYMRYVMGK